MGDGKEWYSNKELFEQLTAFKSEFQDLRAEMRETRTIIKRYNGLREKIEHVEEKIGTLQAKAKGRSSVWSDIRVWGSLMLAFVSVFYAIWSKTH